MHARRRLWGYLAILAGAVFFGAWPTAAKLVLEDVHPLTIVFYTQLLPGLLFLPAVRRVRLGATDRRLVLGTILAGSFLAPIGYFYGLERTTASNAALLSNTESFFTMILAVVLLGERLPRRGYPALLAIAVGAFLVTTELRLGDVTFLEHLLGNVLLLGAACAWALNNVASTVLLRRVGIRALLGLQLFFGAVVVLPVVFLAGAALAIPPAIVPFVVFLAVAGIGVFAMLFYFAFRTIGALRAGSVLSSSSLWGVLLALYVFPEQGLGIWQIVGGALMVGSLVTLYTFAERQSAAAKGETLKRAALDDPKSP